MAHKLTSRLLLAVLALGAPPAAAAATPAVETLPAVDVTQTSATLQARIRPRGDVAQYRFEWGTSDAYGNVTPLRATPNPGRPVDVSQPLGALTPGTTYHFRIVATNESGTTAGQDLQFTTAPGPVAGPSPASDLAGTLPAAANADPVPQLGVSVVVRPIGGTVFVRPAGGGARFVLGAGRHSIPLGSVIDARKGSVRLVTALPDGGTQSGVFARGRFEVRQPPRGRGRTDLLLRGGSFRRCPQRRRAQGAVAARRAYDQHRVVRRLWGRTRGGRFRTHGRDSVATVRGTRWATIDRCDGTLTRVLEGAVRVRDRRKRRTILVRAGQTYLAAR